ncbi:hypothetical protein V6N11_069102 [Hibiscus sabdariffa]|uniref:S-adenosylmethionine synthase n=1 Tax=Hibiscus sabdariffa TaxID=183260 RepID=A0ABR2A5V0_9ROSI
METFLFTSESVNEGHPDKLCDQISDAVLDACLAKDPDSKVACETCTKTNMVMVFGEITTKANVDYEKIVRDTCRSIGFVSDDVGLDADNCKVLVNIEQQSPDIAQGVHGHFAKRPEEIGAGDQDICLLGARLTEVRKNGTCPWLRPDGKTQVTVEYYNDKGAMVPVRVHTVLISTQHDETITNDEIAADLKEHVIKPVIPEKYLDEKTIFHLNPSGRFVIGGPHGDAGLTGRKIIIDTYGGWVSILGKAHNEHNESMRKGCSKLFCEDEHQFERWNHNSIKNLKVEFKRFKDVVVLSLMHPWERDARLLKKELKKGPPQYNVIVKIACTRSSDQLLGARQAYHSLFNRSIEKDLVSHIKGYARKLLVALVTTYRYEGPKVKIDTTKSEAESLLNAIKNGDTRKAVEDDEVIRILSTRSKPHLKEVYKQYMKLSGKTVTEELEVELLLKETVECLCTPQTYFTRVFKAALRDDVNEDTKKTLTRLIVTQESEEMKEVATEFEKQIEERVKGAYKDVLVGVLAKEVK